MTNRHQLTADGWSTAVDAYKRTVDRRKCIESLGYVIVEKWGCDLNKELQKNPEMQKFFDDVEINEPINPRDAFFGGRTNAIKLNHKVGSNQVIR